MFPVACIPRANTANRLGYDADAAAFFTAASITDAGQKTAVNQFVLALKGYSIWALFSRLYPFVGGDATKHAVCLKSLTSGSFVGTVTQDANGITGDGATGYFDTGFSLTSQTTTDNHLSVYSRTTAASAAVEIGALDAASATRNDLWAGDASSRLVARNFNDGAYLLATTANGGHYLSTRTGTAHKGYRNGSQVASNTNTADTPNVAVRNFYVLALNVSNAPLSLSPKNLALASIGTGLDATQAGNFYTAVQAYQTALGRQL